MRLAFDKAIIIVKDDKTDYSFDTSIIEHLTYPRDLRFARIVEFKKTLAAKVTNTYKASQEADHSPFLKNFGKFNVASLAETEVPADALIVEMLDDLRREVSALRRHGKESARLQIGAGEAHMRIRRALTEFLDTNKIRDPMTLMNDEVFVQMMEERCKAPEFFTNPEQFRRALGIALIEMDGRTLRRK